MTAFIIKSTLCSGLLWLIYKYVLETEKTHHFNRFFLIFSLILSFSVPFFNIEFTTEIIQKTQAETSFLLNNNQPFVENNQPVFIQQKTIDYESICLIIWLLICFLFSLKFTKNILAIIQKIKQSKKILSDDLCLVLLPENQAPCSFFHYVFINQNEAHQAKKELLLHEKCHAQQWHTLDVIFIELLQVFFWFNPILILYKKAIKLNHEFLADDAVNFRFQNVVSYQYLLLEKAMGQPIKLTSSSTFQLTKQRLIMMTKHTSALVATSKIVATLVCTLLIGLGFSSTIIAQSMAVSTKKEKMTVEIDLADKNPNNYKVNVEKGEYIVLYDEKPKVWVNAPKKYSELTSSEKKKIGEPLYLAKKMEVSDKNMEEWLDEAKYGVWLNDKKVSNQVLKKYKAAEIHDYFVSKLYANARKNVKYFYQVDITTNNYFENKTVKDFIAKPTFVVDMRTKKMKLK